MLNRPINASDPSGHKCVGEVEECLGVNGGGSLGSDEDEGSIINSAVPLIFGRPDKDNDKNTIGVAGDSSAGLGTVLGDKKTIVTAQHVYLFNLTSNNHDTLWVQVDGEWVTYSLEDLEIITGRGDLVTLTLPSDLPGSVIPAIAASDYNAKPGQSVSVIYTEPIFTDDKLSGYALDILTTVIYDPAVWRTPYGRQLMVSDPANNLGRGDSGGGVFYNGQLIGVNGKKDFDYTQKRSTVAPLCFTWYGWPC